MIVHEVRDPEEAAQFLRQSLWLERTKAPSPAGVKAVLGWALEAASSGEPLPPLGFIADLGQVALDTALVPGRRETQELPGWPAGLVRAYEDYVLGKLAGDRSFERGADALRRYQGRDRERGLVYLLEQVRQRAGFGGVLLNPAVIKNVQQQDPGEFLGQGWQELRQEGPLPWLPALVDELIAALRNSADLVGPEDIFELEHGTALAPFAQRVALRQVLHAAELLRAGLPAQPPRPHLRRHDVPSNLLTEDAYPVGGFASLSTRGSIESLLHSQLAFMEPADRPDLFDVKFLRDELLYYSRDENQFLRRRRSFVFAFYPDLVHARLKDPGLPYQRIILLLGLVVAAIRKLIEWLHEEALVFDVIFITESGATPLESERGLLEMVLREEIANQTVVVRQMAATDIAAHAARQARRSLCQCWLLSTQGRDLDAENVAVGELVLSQAVPGVHFQGEATQAEAETPVEGWVAILEKALERMM